MNKHVPEAQPVQLSLALTERGLATLRKALAEPAGPLRDGAASQEVVELIRDLVLLIDRSGSLQVLDGLTGESRKPVASLSRLIARAYGAAAARVVVSGSSGANLMVQGFVAPALMAPDRRAILVDRDAHVSVIGGLACSGLEAVFLHRRYDAANDIQAPFTAEEVMAALDARPDIGAVALTSPTYEGCDLPIQAIAAGCQARGVLLIVDGAWGSCHGVLSHVGFPPSAVQLGADIVIVSIHKKGLAPSQVAGVLFRDRAHARLLDNAGNLGFQTTSPSYVLLGVAESCLHEAVTGGADAGWKAAIEAAAALAERIPREVNPLFRIMRPADVGAVSGDPGHLLIHVGDAMITGYELLTALGELGMDAEKATRDTLLVLVGPREAERLDDWLATFREATTRALHRRMGSARVSRDLAIPGPERETVMSIRQAVQSPSRRVVLAQAAGEVAAAPVAVYPPGSALLMPGERIEQRHVDYLEAILDQNGRIRGLDERDRTLGVISRT